MTKIFVSNGDRFGLLTVLDFNGRRGGARRDPTFKCKCDCGAVKVISQRCLIEGKSKSCGCWRVQVARKLSAVNIKHGMIGTRIYRIWQGMKRRCLTQKRYQGRGIKVNAEWESFSRFYADMGLPPTDRHTLDRINNDGDYEKSNCRWATRGEQMRNQSRNRMVTAWGETKILIDWMTDRRCKVRSYARLRARLDSGWKPEDAIQTSKVLGQNQTKNYANGYTANFV